MTMRILTLAVAGHFLVSQPMGMAQTNYDGTLFNGRQTSHRIMGDDQARQNDLEICLNGEWNFQIDGATNSVKVRVPGSYTGLRKVGADQYYDVWNYPLQWEGKGGTYGRTFVLPSSMRDKRVSFWCGGVRHACTVKVNGMDVGGYAGSTTPFERDITKALRSGVNKIEVQVDAGALDSEDGNSNRRGFWGDVYLKARGDVHITDDSFVSTSVTQKKINYQVVVANDGNAARQFSIQCLIMDRAGKIVREFAGGKHTVLPGATEVIEVSSAWENPHLWSLDDPYLYRLQTVINDESGKIISAKQQHFGFREFTWKGSRVYLNGNLLCLRGAGDHSDGDLSCDTEYMRRWIKELKREGICFMRLHTMVKSAATFDVADEEGFLLEVEAPHHFNLPSPERARFNVEQLVKAYRNHPSVFLWSVGNELRWKGIAEPGYLIDLCHKLDPTHPAFTSDFSGWSVLGDVLGHHYDTFQVFDEWAKYGPEKPMIWDEFGWIWPWDRPVSSGPAGYEYASQDVSGAALWRDAAEEIRKGIEFFQDGETFSNELHRVTVWSPWDYSENFHRYQPFNNFQNLTLSYSNIEGSPGIKPTTIKPGSSFVNVWDQTLPAWEPNPGYDVIAPYLKVVRFWDREPRAVTFFGGEEVMQHGRICYDDLRPCDELACRVETLDDKLLSETKTAISLQPGDMKEDIRLRWKLPQVSTLTPVRMVREFRFNGKTGYRDVAQAKVFPRLKPALLSGLAEKKLAVSDAALANWFKNQGFQVTDSSQADIWIVTEETPAVRDFVRRGGRVLQLAVTRTSNADEPLYQLTAMSEKLSARTPLDTKGETSARQNFLWRAWNAGDERNPVFFTEASMDGAFIRYVPPEKSGSLLYVDLIKDGKNARLVGTDRLTLATTVGVDFKKVDIGEKSWLTHKELLPILRTHDSEWFVASTNDAIVLEQAEPAPNGIAVSKNLQAVAWHRIKNASPVLSGPIESEAAMSVPDFSAVTAFGVCVAKDVSEKVSLRFFSISAMGNAPAAAHIPINGAPHRILAGLGQEDFTFWRGGSSWDIIPVPLGGKNVRVILHGNKDGNGAALAEFPLGAGNRIVSALNLADSLEKEPAAQWLLRNTLQYLADYRPAVAQQKTVVAVGKKWNAQLHEIGLVAESLPANKSWNLQGVGKVILDASVPEVIEGCRQNAGALRDFVRDGGTVLVLEMNQRGVDTFQSLTVRKLRLTEPFLGVRDVCIKAPVSWTRRTTPPTMLEVYDGILTHQAFEANYDPLISGLANDDLNWRGKPMFESGIEIEGMDTVMAKPDYSILISNWRVSLEQPANGLFREYIHAVHDLRQNSWFVNRDPVLLRVNAGNGAWLFCQLDLTGGGERGRRVLAELLTNMRCAIGEPTQFAPNDFTFDGNLQQNQLERFAEMAGQVAPGRRQFYGTPKPLPDYLQNTFADSAHTAAGALPTIQMLGDDLMLRFAPAVKSELFNKFAVTFSDKPLGNTRDTLSALGLLLASNHWNTIFLSVGPEDLRLLNGKPAVGLEEFKANLETVFSKLAGAAGKIYWSSIIIPQENRSQYAGAAAAAYNAVAEEICKKHNVYYINLNAIAEQAAPGNSRKYGQPFLQSELEEIGRRVASALTFFG